MVYYIHTERVYVDTNLFTISPPGNQVVHELHVLLN